MNPQKQGITDKLIRNIYGSTLFKAIDVIFNFLLVRFAIDFFGAEDYGIWLTILSFFTWFSVIEFGVSSSFRNHLTKFFSDKDYINIRIWISSGYKATTIIYSGMILLGVILYNLTGFEFDNQSTKFNWVFQLSFTMYMIYYIFFCLQSVLLATHNAQITYIISALQKVVLLVGILLFSFFELTPSLSFICLWFSAIPLIIWGLANMITYRKILPDLKPKFNSSTKEKIQSLKQINLAFFLIQIATLIIYSTDNLIILNRLNGTDVTTYNIAFKYFNIVLLPYWAAFTEADHKNDVPWIKTHIKRLILLWTLMAFGSILMLFLAPIAYEIWIGKVVHIPFELSFFMAISILITCWNNIFAYYLNSIAKTNLQLVVIVVSAIINIPLSFYLLDLWGITGVIIATSCVLAPLAIALPIQYLRIIRNKITA